MNRYIYKYRFNPDIEFNEYINNHDYIYEYKILINLLYLFNGINIEICNKPIYVCNMSYLYIHLNDSFKLEVVFDIDTSNMQNYINSVALYNRPCKMPFMHLFKIYMQDIIKYNYTIEKIKYKILSYLECS